MRKKYYVKAQKLRPQEYRFSKLEKNIPVKKNPLKEKNFAVLLGSKSDLKT